ncbi:hypothetical protein ACFLS1_06740 [Verrucomicrobiota bacterium]
MKTLFKIQSLAAILAICVMLQPSIGCAGKVSAKESIKAAVVPEADVVLRADIGAMSGTPISKAMEKFNEDNKGLDSSIAENEKKEEAFKKATGLTDKDIIAGLFSCDVDGIDFDNPDKNQIMAQIKASAGIALKKSVDTAKLKAGLKAVIDESEGVQILDIDISGVPALELKSATPDDPTIYIAVASNGKAVFTAFNKQSLQAALKRAAAKKYEKISPEIETAANTLPAGSQMKLSFVLPESIREQIRQKVAEAEGNAQNDPNAAMMLGFITPMKGLKSISLGAKLADILNISLACDLATEQEAMQIKMILQTMAMPVIMQMQAAQAQNPGAAPMNIAEILNIDSKGSAVTLSLRFTEDQIKAQMKSSMMQSGSPMAPPPAPLAP